MRPPYSGGVLRVVLCAVLAASTRTVGVAAAPAADRADASVFGGLGTWVDIYDGAVYAAPERTAQRIAARRVKTVWVETANYGASVDVVSPSARTARRRAPCARHPRCLLVPAGAREARARQAPCAGDAGVSQPERRPVRRRGAQHRGDEASERDAPLAARGRARRAGARGSGGDAARDHPVQPTRSRAAAVDMAALPMGRARGERRRLRADDLHGRCVQGLRRHVRVRHACAAAASANTGRPTSRSTSPAGSPIGSGPRSSPASPRRSRTTGGLSASACTTG